MGKILTILYLISAIYVIWLFFKLILSIKSKTYDDTTSKFANRYTGLLLVLSMMIFCLSLSILSGIINASTFSLFTTYSKYFGLQERYFKCLKIWSQRCKNVCSMTIIYSHS